MGHEFYDDTLKPDDLEKYCHLRCLYAYYFNLVISKIDEEKLSLKTDFTFMSYFNFMFPNGKAEVMKEPTFKDISEICDYIGNQKQKQEFLEKL